MKVSPTRLYLTYSFITSTLYSLIFTVNLLYYILVARLNPLQLVLVGTTVEASIFIFEIPTGVLADSYSRRLSVILGVFILGIAFLVNGLWPIFWVIALAQVLWGIGYTFTSGAHQAWISDEVGEENAGKVFLQGARMDQLGTIAGTILSIGFALFSLRAPILVGGTGFILLGVMLLLTMSESGFIPVPRGNRNNFQHMTSTLKRGVSLVKLKPALLGILVIGFFYGLYSEGYDRLWQADLLDRFSIPAIPWLQSISINHDINLVAWYAGLKVLMMTLAIFLTSVAEMTLVKFETKKLTNWLTLLSAGLLACLVGFAVSGKILVAVVFVILIGTLREVIYPIYTTWVNHHLDSSVRATVHSMSKQVDAVGQILGGPVVGVIARQVSMTAGLLTSSILLAPVLILLGIKRTKEIPLTKSNPGI